MRTKDKTSKLPQERENLSEQTLVGFSFESDWLKNISRSQRELINKQTFENAGKRERPRRDWL